MTACPYQAHQQGYLNAPPSLGKQCASIEISMELWWRFCIKEKGFSSTTHQDSVLGHWSTHDHVGGYAWNSAWIHHTSITFARVKESINNNYFDTAHLYDKKLILMGTEVYPVFCMYFIKYPIASWTVDDDFFYTIYTFYVTSQTFVFRDTNSFYKVWYFFYQVLHVFFIRFFKIFTILMYLCPNQNRQVSHTTLIWYVVIRRVNTSSYRIKAIKYSRPHNLTTSLILIGFCRS